MAAPAPRVLLEPMGRPDQGGYGTVGRSIQLHVNCFPVKLDVNANTVWSVYAVTILPKRRDGTTGLLPPKQLLRNIWREVEKMNKWDGIRPVYDGRAMLYSARPLPNEKEDALNFDVELPGRGVFRVTLSAAVQISPMELVNYFSSGGDVFQGEMQSSLQALNVLSVHGLGLEFPSNRSTWFMPNAESFGLARTHNAFPVGGGVELWRGFFSTIRTCYEGLYLNIGLTSGAFLLAKQGQFNVIAFCLDFLGFPANAHQRLAQLNGPERIKLNRVLRTATVKVDNNVHRSNGKPIGSLKIRLGLSDKTPRSHSFALRDTGEIITVEEYFSRFFNLRLRYPDLPCVEVKQNVLYPIELLTIAQGNKYAKRLSSRQIDAGTRFQQLPPRERLEAIVKIRQSAVENFIGPYLPDFGLEIGMEPMQISGRVLVPPKICLKDRRGDSSAIVDQGAWKVARNSQQLVEPSNISSFAVIITGRVDPRVVMDFIDKLMETARQVGMGVPRVAAGPQMFVDRGRGGQLERDFDEAVERARRSMGEPVVVFNLFDNESEDYAPFKALGVARGIATQAIRIDKARNKLRDFTFLLGVLMKINVKLGGLNFVPMAGTTNGNGNGAGWLEDHKALVFGADLIHSEDKPSIAAVVMSIDRKAQRYIDEVVVQPLIEPSDESTKRAKKSEIILDLEEIIYKLLNRFFELFPGKAPASFVFYRDGCSESEFAAVLEHEIPAIHAACTKIRAEQAELAAWAPKLTFVVATKRHHIRAFPVGPRDGQGRQGNVPAGTVFDVGVTDARAWDFYLAAHHGIIGTTRPTRFVVMSDDHKITADELQAMTNTLSHSYQRCNRSVSIPAPTYYADLICTKARLGMPLAGLGSSGASVAGTASSVMTRQQRAADLVEWQNALRESNVGRARLGGGKAPSMWWQ